jgi:hypothetical protein
MLSATLGKPQLSTRPVRRKPKVVTKRLLPVNSAAGAASEIVTPAVFSPIGAPVTDDTGILFPVFFCAVPDRAAAIQKDGTLKLPAIPVWAFPIAGKAPSSFDRAKPTLRSYFCSSRPSVARVVMEGSLSNDDI